MRKVWWVTNENIEVLGTKSRGVGYKSDSGSQLTAATSFSGCCCYKIVKGPGQWFPLVKYERE